MLPAIKHPAFSFAAALKVDLYRFESFDVSAASTVEEFMDKQEKENTL